MKAIINLKLVKIFNITPGMTVTINLDILIPLW